jgi:hypothetical protein
MSCRREANGRRKKSDLVERRGERQEKGLIQRRDDVAERASVSGGLHRGENLAVDLGGAVDLSRAGVEKRQLVRQVQPVRDRSHLAGRDARSSGDQLLDGGRPVTLQLEDHGLSARAGHERVGRRRTNAREALPGFFDLCSRDRRLVAVPPQDLAAQTRRQQVGVVAGARSPFCPGHQIERPPGRAEREVGRYVGGELPTLPFTDGSFDLALCSHLLFLYSAQLGEAFHHQSLRELCRVACEVRIFPLLALNWKRSPFVDGAMADLRTAGHDVSIESVPYEFQRGANQMMRVRSRAGVATARAT